MARPNIKVTETFISKTVNIVLTIHRNGTNYQRISDELADFVQNKLIKYNTKLYNKIQSQRFEYNSNKVFISWKGGGERTIKRLVQTKKCSEDLFHVIGYYLFQFQWDTTKQNSFIDNTDEQQKERYIVYFDTNDKKDWVISLGVSAGFCNNSTDSPKFELYHEYDNKKLIGIAHVNLIGFDSSSFDFCPVKIDYQLEKDKKYLAFPIKTSVKPLLVKFTGKREDRSLLEKVINKSSISRVKIVDQQDTEFSIKWNPSKQRYFFCDKNRSIFITSIPWDQEHLTSFVPEYLNHIYYWKHQQF